MVDENSYVDFSLKSAGDSGVSGATAYFRGDVGIGTATPVGKLNVVGDINVTSNNVTQVSCVNFVNGASWCGV